MEEKSVVTPFLCFEGTRVVSVVKLLYLKIMRLCKKEVMKKLVGEAGLYQKFWNVQAQYYAG